MKVFFYEAFAEEEQLLRKHLPDDFEPTFVRETIQEHGRSPTPPAEIISVRTQSDIPAQWAPHLRAVLARATGYDQLLDWQERTRADKVALGYLPLYCARAVAEQAALLWLALLRKLPRQMQQFRKFQRDNLTGSEAEGKTLVVYGVGHIGYEIVRIGRGLGMSVYGVDIEKRYDDVAYRTPEEILPHAQVLVAAMNLTTVNRAIFNEELLNKTPRGCIFVNVSRGELSPATTLLKLLEEGHLGGVGLDVFNEEQNLAHGLRGASYEKTPEIAAIAPLLKHPNSLLTPHNAFNTREAVDRKAFQSVEQLLHLRKTSHFLWPVPQ